jgi:6-phosphogluconolactonase
MYEKHLRDFFHSKPLTESIKVSENTIFPSFDLILLGMGTDGHTASLFPGSDFLDEKEKWVAAVSGEQGSPPVPRITLTLPVLNQAKNVLFLISGNKKKKILDTFLDKPEKAEMGLPGCQREAPGKPYMDCRRKRLKPKRYRSLKNLLYRSGMAK